MQEGFFVALRLPLRVEPSMSKLLILPRGETGRMCSGQGNWRLHKMVVGEGFFVALRLTLRVKPSRSKLLILPRGESGRVCSEQENWGVHKMVVGEGFEPSKSMTADLQSDPFGHSGTPPRGRYSYCFRFSADGWKRGASYQMRCACKVRQEELMTVCRFFIQAADLAGKSAAQPLIK